MKKIFYYGDLGKYKHVKSELVYGEEENSACLISFCIPTYNRQDTLLGTLQSILEQEYDYEYEIIIADNSTIENTNLVVRFLEEHNYKKVRYYVNQENIGMTGNWNRLVELARGKYISFVHDDDLLDVAYSLEIKKCILAGEKEKNLGFIKVKFQEFESQEEKYITNNRNRGGLRKIYMLDSLIKGIGPTTTPTCGMIFWKEGLLNIGGFKEQFYPCADHIIGFVMQQRGYKGYITEDKLAYYRWGINETLNTTTQIETCKKNYMIRKYIYQNNWLYRVYGAIFYKTYYSKNANEIMKYLNINNKQFKKESLVENVEYEKNFIKEILVSIFMLVLRGHTKMRRIYRIH